MKELKVGEKITITLEVVEELTCYGCFFLVHLSASVVDLER